MWEVGCVVANMHRLYILCGQRELTNFEMSNVVHRVFGVLRQIVRAALGVPCQELMRSCEEGGSGSDLIESGV